MKIRENSFIENESYPAELRDQVKTVFEDAVQRYEWKRLFNQIKKDSAELRNLFWTEEELAKKQEAVNFFDERMRAMVYYTLKNMERYQQSGWKELMDEGESHDGTDDSIQ